MISRIDPERKLYEARLQERRDKAALQQAADRALQKGLSEGRAEGRAEERAERWRDDIRYLQEVLGQNVMTSVELEALSLGELESLMARLRAELKASRNGS